MEKNRNTRILKNSFWLYLRMILNLGIALYSSRVLLNALGVDDFGTVGLLTSLIMMFMFFQAAVSNVLQRFLNILIEKKDVSQAQIVFSMVVIFTVSATIAVLLGESFFCEWILTHKLKIAPEAMSSARFLFYCLLCAVFFQMTVLPWQEMVLAKEQMDFYAIICLCNSSARLLLAMSLQLFCSRRLEIYGLGLIGIAMLYWTAAVLFCKWKNPESKFHLTWDRSLCKEMLPFFSYTLVGGTLYSLSFQGIVVLLGAFFGPAVNAAYVVANQLRTTTIQISTCLAAAVKPQMIQSYAGGEIEYMRKLFFSACKLNFFALFFAVTPIMAERSYILKIWLKIVPEQASNFAFLLLLSALIASFSAIFALVNMATGMNKNFEIKGRLITIGSLGVAYLVLKFDGPEWSPIAIFVSGEFIAAGYLLWDIKHQIGISIMSYLKDVVAPVAICSIASWSILYSIKLLLPGDGICRLATVFLLSLLINFLLCFFFGCNKEEKTILLQLVQHLKHLFLHPKMLNS